MSDGQSRRRKLSIEMDEDIETLVCRLACQCGGASTDRSRSHQNISVRYKRPRPAASVSPSPSPSPSPPPPPPPPITWAPGRPRGGAPAYHVEPSSPSPMGLGPMPVWGGLHRHNSSSILNNTGDRRRQQPLNLPQPLNATPGPGPSTMAARSGNGREGNVPRARRMSDSDKYIVPASDDDEEVERSIRAQRDSSETHTSDCECVDCNRGAAAFNRL